MIRVSSLRDELARKGVHIAMGGFALSLRWLTPLQAASCAFVALLFNLVVLHRLTQRRLLRAGERARGFSWGIALYPAAVLGLILVFHRRLELAAAGWGLLAFGDGMATVAGVTVGGPRLPWNSRKTWSGWIAFVLYGTATTAFLIRWTQAAVLDAARRGGPGVDHVGASFLATGAGAAFSDFWVLIAGCLAAALVAAVVESAETGLDDNVLVPVTGGAALWAATLVQPAQALEAIAGLGPVLLAGAGINLLLAVVAYAARSVALSGAIVGWLLGTTLYAFAGWRGFSLLAAFFLLGTVATKLGYARKAALGIAQEKGGRRGAGNAVANAGAGVLFAVLAVATEYSLVCTVAMAAAFATAANDTVSSEVGQAYGRRHFLITTLRRVAAGTDGAVSVEGTVAGLVAGAGVGLLAAAVGLMPAAGAAVVALAALAGGTLESYLGATVTGLNNELVNFANTLIGALVAVGLTVAIL